MKKLFRSVLALSTVFILNSCQSAKPVATNTSNSDLLYNYKWYVSDLEGKPYLYSGKNNEETYLSFSKKDVIKVSGFTGCNRLMGTAELNDKNALKFSPLATTKMACPGSDNMESVFLTALSKVTNYTVINDQLQLKNGDSVLAVFNGVSPEMEKLSRTWELDYISGPRIAFDGLYPDKKPFVSFNFSAKQLMGNSSCNGFSAKYVIDGNKIGFKDYLKTMMFCEGGGEETFLNMLKKVNKFSVNENTLTFLIDDVAVMRFKKK